jgi:hypothetical protein
MTKIPMLANMQSRSVLAYRSGPTPSQGAHVFSSTNGMAFFALMT